MGDDDEFDQLYGSHLDVAPGLAFTATIQTGAAGEGGSSNAFPINLLTVLGGSGAFTYACSDTNDGKGLWGVGSVPGNQFQASVADLTLGQTSNATVICTVKDSVTSVSIQSNAANYGWTHGTHCPNCATVRTRRKPAKR